MAIEPTSTPNEAPTGRRLEGYDAAAAAISALVTGARHEVLVFAPTLDRRLFNTASFVDPVTQLISRHARNHTRLLVEDTEYMLKENRRVTELCRKFSTRVSMRRFGESERGRNDMFVISDQAGYLYQLNRGQPVFFTRRQARREALEYAQDFAAAWNCSDPVPELHTLGL